MKGNEEGNDGETVSPTRFFLNEILTFDGRTWEVLTSSHDKRKI